MHTFKADTGGVAVCSLVNQAGLHTTLQIRLQRSLPSGVSCNIVIAPDLT